MGCLEGLRTYTARVWSSIAVLPLMCLQLASRFTFERAQDPVVDAVAYEVKSVEMFEIHMPL